MSGWNLKSGDLKQDVICDDQYWALFNYVYSDSSRKRSTYKYGLIKSILDNLFNVDTNPDELFLSYEAIFEKFANNYWNLVVKYSLKQIQKDGRSESASIETLFNNQVALAPELALLEFDNIAPQIRDPLVASITKLCKRNVIGALYSDFDGYLYGFDLKGNGIRISRNAYYFMLKYKPELEKLNYYSWAKFLEKVNQNNIDRILNKLELATPRRSNLSIYRDILYKEFEEQTCFYCGKKLNSLIQVDHFIPWSFVKDDKMWNFVLSCPRCNSKKKDLLPPSSFINRLVLRNSVLVNSSNALVSHDFLSYNDSLIHQMWKYAKISGFREAGQL